MAGVRRLTSHRGDDTNHEADSPRADRPRAARPLAADLRATAFGVEREDFFERIGYPPWFSVGNLTPVEQMGCPVR